MPKLTVGVKVAPPANGGRRLVITDIHGCAKTFQKLLDKVQLTEDDQLFILGDFINRGPRSLQVVDTVLKLTRDGFDVFPLMGNHEETVLHILKEQPAELPMLLKSRNSLNLLNKRGIIRKRVFRFIRALPYYYQLDDVYLVHAGFNMKAENPFLDKHAMVWVRNFFIEKKLNKRRVLFGHTPTKLSKIQTAVDSKTKYLCLDNGCSHTYLGKEYGRLLCYDLDSGELYKQKNID